MLKIPEIKNLPDGAVVDAVQVTVKNVYERNSRTGSQGRPTTVQNCTLADDAGNEIKASVWDHPDLAPLKGTTVVLHSSRGGNGRFGGVSVKHGSYVTKKAFGRYREGDRVSTIDLSVGKSGIFQHVEVYKSQAGAVGQTDQPQDVGSDTGGSGQAEQRQMKTINGMTVGMAINNAVKVIVEGGIINRYDDGKLAVQLPKDVFIIASGLIRVSQHMESGHLAPIAKESANAGDPEPQDEFVEKALEAAKKLTQGAENQDEDLPF